MPNNTFNTDGPKTCAFGSALCLRSARGLTLALGRIRMTKDRIVAEERWHFVVFERAGSYFATFLSGGVVDVDRSVRLTESEVAALNNGTSAKALIEQFRANADAIADRLLNPPVWPSK